MSIHGLKEVTRVNTSGRPTFSHEGDPKLMTPIWVHCRPEHVTRGLPESPWGEGGGGKVGLRKALCRYGTVCMYTRTQKHINIDMTM